MMKKARTGLSTVLAVAMILAACSAESDSNELYISGAQKRTEKIPQYISGVASTIYTHEGMNRALVLNNREYDNENLMDIYYPPGWEGGEPLPVMVFLNGLSGMDSKDLGHMIDWSLLTAAEGMAAVSFNTTYSDKDSGLAIDYLVDNAETLGLDPDRIGIFTSCGVCFQGAHVLKTRNLKVGVFLYGLLPEYSEIPTETTIIQVKPGIGLEKNYASSIESFHHEAREAGARAILLDFTDGRKYFDITETSEPSWISAVNPEMAADIDRMKHILAVMKEELSA